MACKHLMDSLCCDSLVSILMCRPCLMTLMCAFPPHRPLAGVGKSTLMRAIAANKVDGFPPPDRLRTVYVEHDIQVRGRRGALGDGDWGLYNFACVVGDRGE